MAKRNGAGPDLYFLPLGGAGEIGMNLNLYRHAGKWLMIDLGITFGDDLTPGIEVIMPDPAFIEEEREDLVGLVLTHAHEDHLGAVPYLWPRLGCPIYATPFTAAVLRRKLAEHGLADKVPLREVAMSGRFGIGPFDLELITLTHSIPEPNAVVIRTAAGTVLHTGDWKFDPDPLIGPTADERRLIEVGNEGVLALVGDSTNVFRPGEAGSEASVREALTALVAARKGKVAVACFASNVARLSTIAEVARRCDRHAALVGRSLHRIDEAARATGYLKGVPPFLSDHDAGFLPADKVLLICTGSQGEPRAALTRIAEGSHPHVTLGPGDAVIFSSRIIPGNERAIGRLQNRLADRGVEIVTERDEAIHVSGHPARDELARMYQHIRPRIAVPVHGEARHLREHAALALSCQVPHAVVVANGDLLRLAPGAPEIVDQVASGRLAVDGKRLVALDDDMLRDRHRLTFNGTAMVTVVLDRNGKLLAEAQVSAPGLLAAEDAAIGPLIDAVDAAVAKLPASARRDDDQVREAARRAARRHLHDTVGKKPLTEVHVVRV